jgi:hypothetical protein
MNLLFDSFWRAAAYCLHPRVILLSIAPLLLMGGLAFGLGYFFWEDALDVINHAFASWDLMATFVGWLERVGLGGLKAALAPLVVVLIVTPLVVVAALLVVAALMTPAIVRLVAARRFPTLERASGGSLAGGALGAMGATLVALVALVVSIPLWLVPPLALVLPPLIWGWLTYRVLTYDVLADHATREERRAIVSLHRVPLLAMGVLCGYLGAAPSLVWVSGVMFIVLAPLLVPLAIWIYTLVFAFSSLWYTHYALAALQQLREARVPAPMQPAPVPVTAAPAALPMPPGSGE